MGSNLARLGTFLWSKEFGSIWELAEKSTVNHQNTGYIVGIHYTLENRVSAISKGCVVFITVPSRRLHSNPLQIISQLKATVTCFQRLHGLHHEELSMSSTRLKMALITSPENIYKDLDFIVKWLIWWVLWNVFMVTMEIIELSSTANLYGGWGIVRGLTRG